MSKRNDIYGSSPDGAIPVWPLEMPREAVDLQKAVLLNMDAPQHTRLRKIISRGFTPRAVGRLQAELAERAQKIAETAAASGSGDFVEQVSCELPLQAIAGLLGVPQDDRDKLFRWSNEMTAGEDPEYADVDPAMSSFELITYAMKMAEERKAKNPTDDIVTQLIEADIEGEKLSDDEFGFFVVMLAVAGNETTRNSITHGMIAFSQYPRAVGAVQEGAPGVGRRRDRALGHTGFGVPAHRAGGHRARRRQDQEGRAGGHVLPLGQLRRRGRSRTRTPSTSCAPRIQHVGFGGTGAHYCIGANLARMTINLIFNAVADHMPDLTPIGEPERLKSGWLNGIKHWQVDYTGSARRRAGESGRRQTNRRRQLDQGGFGWISVRTKSSRLSPMW